MLLPVFGCKGEGVCGRYVPEDHDAKLVEPPFALGCPKVWMQEVSPDIVTPYWSEQLPLVALLSRLQIRHRDSL